MLYSICAYLHTVCHLPICMQHCTHEAVHLNCTDKALCAQLSAPHTSTPLWPLTAHPHWWKVRRIDAMRQSHLVSRYSRLRSIPAHR